MTDNLTIRELTEGEADFWLKKLYALGGELLEDFRKAFHDEKSSFPPQALPPEKRKYYMVYANGSEELLAGINSEHINISSFTKVVSKNKSKAKGRDCIRELIEKIVIIECKKKGKTFFSVSTNEDGRRVFEYLKNNKPKGIKEIKSQPPTGVYYNFVSFIDEQI